MQEKMVQLQEDLHKAKEQLVAGEEEKDRGLDDLEEMKVVADEANSRLSDAFLSETPVKPPEFGSLQKQHTFVAEALLSSNQELNRVRQELVLALEAKNAALKEARETKNIADANAKKVADLFAELNSVNRSLADSSGVLGIREKNIESMKLELKKAKQMEYELSVKTVSLEKLKQKLSDTIESESCAMELLAECKVRIQTLESETEKAKESETKIFDSLISQTKQFEETKILLEEAKIEIASLKEKVESLDDDTDIDETPHSIDDNHFMEETVESLKSDLRVTKECLAHAQEEEGLALLKAHNLTKEMSLLKNELKLAIEAEEKSKKAMDDLALALKEVSTEANGVKEKLNSTESELDNARAEAEHSNQMVKSTEKKFQVLLDEARKELDRVNETVERLKLEAEEAVLAWNGKEIEFISCIKRAEDESTDANQENTRLKESLKAAEESSKVSREENHKLRDILKHAINESTVAKEAAGIAQAENSQLKDCVLEKDNALMMLSQENKQLRINETAARENIKELKRLLSTASTTPLKAEAKEAGQVLKKQISNVEGEHKEGKKLSKVLSLTKQISNVEEEHQEGRNLSKVLSVTLEDLRSRIPNGYTDKDVDEDPERAETLKGSIFDVDSPVQVAGHSKQSSSLITDDRETIISEDFDNLDASHFDDLESDRSSQRKKKALLRRVGDLLMRKSFHKRDSSVG